MAETAKMLNPDKRVLLPDLKAGCSLAESCPADKLDRYQEMLRENGRKFQTVTYINSTAAVKALSDWVVTSGNAEEIIRRVPSDLEILFVPDRHLGQLSGGSDGPQDDPVERRLHRARDLQRRRSAGAEEEDSRPASRSPIRNARPTSASTAISSAAPRRCSNIVGEFAEPSDFLVATEANMMWQMQSKFPRHRYHPVPGITCACNKCPHMARNTLEKLRDCLLNGTPEIAWQPEFEQAREVVQRSLLN